MKIRLLEVVLIVALFFLNAGTAVAEEGVSVSLETVYKSRYICSSGDVIYDDPVQQSNLLLSFKNGLWVDVWGSFDWKGQENEGDEVDFGIGWSGGDEIMNAEVGIYYWDCIPNFDSKGDYIQPYFKIGKNFQLDAGNSISPFFRMEIVVPLEQEMEDFEAYFVGLEYSWGAGRILLESTPCLLHETIKGGIIGSFDFRAGYEILQGLRVVGDFQFLIPLSEIKKYQNETSVGGGLSYEF